MLCRCFLCTAGNFPTFFKPYWFWIGPWCSIWGEPGKRRNVRLSRAIGSASSRVIIGLGWNEGNWWSCPEWIIDGGPELPNLTLWPSNLVEHEKPLPGTSFFMAASGAFCLNIWLVWILKRETRPTQRNDVYHEQGRRLMGNLRLSKTQRPGLEITIYCFQSICFQKEEFYKAPKLGHGSMNRIT